MDHRTTRKTSFRFMSSSATDRWQRSMRGVLQFVSAGALLAAGIVYTVQTAHPRFGQPGEMMRLPGAVIQAPSISEQATRVAQVLRQYTKDGETANRIAGAVIDESARRKIDPALLVGVLLTEDATLDTMAKSNVGARGLMQVMPLHSGKWGCNSSNLFSIESNICHGASILEDVMRTAPSTRVALLRYNGCVHGSNTRNCHSYPDKVIRSANRASAEMLTMAD